MRKRILAILTAAVCVLSGCNSDPGEPPRGTLMPTDNAPNTPNDNTPGSGKTPTQGDPVQTAPKDEAQKPENADPDNTPAQGGTQNTPEPDTQKPADVTLPGEPGLESSPESVTAAYYPQISQAELKSAIDKFPLDSVTLPDGSTVSKNQAISANASGEALIFPFAFYRIASPVFRTTADDPSLIRYVNGNWESAVDTDALAKEIDLTYKKAVKGTALGNGLTVHTAECQIDSRGEITDCCLYFDGEITLTGVLHYLPEEVMYITSDTMDFRPDLTKASLPVIYSNSNWIGQFWDGFGNPENDPPFYMYFDLAVWTLGSKSAPQYSGLGLDDLFGDKTTVITALTISDLSFTPYNGASGRIVDIG